MVDYNTPIPGGSENFVYFLSDNPAISENDVAFHGVGGVDEMEFTFSTEPS